MTCSRCSSLPPAARQWIACALVAMTTTLCAPHAVAWGQLVDEFDGFTEPLRVVSLASDETGTIAELLVAEGDYVEKGEPIARLDDEQSPVRLAAEKELRRHGRAVEADLRAALEKTESVEVFRRVKRLLAALPPHFPPEDVPALRAVELLELIGDGEARALLGELARGRPGAPLTREAKAALDRLGK